jgi:hypothetical protein
MGKRGGWFSAVKKALGAEPKEKKDQVWMVISIYIYVCVCVIYFLLDQRTNFCVVFCN